MPKCKNCGEPTKYLCDLKGFWWCYNCKLFIPLENLSEIQRMLTRENYYDVENS